MANYVFETMTQADAAAFNSGDFLIFSNAANTAISLIVTPTGGDNVTQPALQLSGAGRTTPLTFNAANLSASSTSGRLVFNDNSSLLLGTNGDDGTGFQGTSGNDVIYGFGGADSLGGGAGNDYLYGGNGNDTLVGGAGNDHIYGSALTGASSVLAGDGADSIVAGDGNDYVNGNGGNDTIDGGVGSDRLFGGGGADSIVGSDGNDIVNGNQGDDTISGGLGNDILRGGQGADSISGGDGNDIVYGDLGNDTVIGGAGLDVLFGGDGADRFQFAVGDAAFTTTSGADFANVTDIVADFTDGTDLLALGFNVTAVARDTQNTTFSTLQAANTYAQQLLDASTATSGQVAALRVGSDTYLFYNDATGADSINSAIKLAGVGDPTVITTADFATI